MHPSIIDLSRDLTAYFVSVAIAKNMSSNAGYHYMVILNSECLRIQGEAEAA